MLAECADPLPYIPKLEFVENVIYIEILQGIHQNFIRTNFDEMNTEHGNLRVCLFKLVIIMVNVFL